MTNPYLNLPKLPEGYYWEITKINREVASVKLCHKNTTGGWLAPKMEMIDSRIIETETGLGGIITATNEMKIKFDKRDTFDQYVGTYGD